MSRLKIDTTTFTNKRGCRPQEAGDATWTFALQDATSAAPRLTVAGEPFDRALKIACAEAHKVGARIIRVIP